MAHNTNGVRMAHNTNGVRMGKTPALTPALPVPHHFKCTLEECNAIQGRGKCAKAFKAVVCVQRSTAANIKRSYSLAPTPRPRYKRAP